MTIYSNKGKLENGEYDPTYTLAEIGAQDTLNGEVVRLSLKIKNNENEFVLIIMSFYTMEQKDNPESICMLMLLVTTENLKEISPILTFYNNQNFNNDELEKIQIFSVNSQFWPKVAPNEKYLILKSKQYENFHQISTIQVYSPISNDIKFIKKIYGDELPLVDWE